MIGEGSILARWNKLPYFMLSQCKSIRYHCGLGQKLMLMMNLKKAIQRFFRAFLSHMWNFWENWWMHSRDKWRKRKAAPNKTITFWECQWRLASNLAPYRRYGQSYGILKSLLKHSFYNIRHKFMHWSFRRPCGLMEIKPPRQMPPPAALSTSAPTSPPHPPKFWMGTELNEKGLSTRVVLTDSAAVLEMLSQQHQQLQFFF